MSQALGVIKAVGQIFGQSGTVSIGSVTLTEMELPTAMPIGGRHSVAVHKMPGGARVLNPMGPDDAPIAWSGVLYGSDQSARARLLDAMRKSGQVVTLAWDVFSYQVIVSAFSWQSKEVGPGPYKIECTVQQDNSSTSGQTLVSLASQVTADLSNGNPVAALSAVSAGVVSGPYTTAQAAAAQPNATSVGSAAYGTAVGAINDVSAAVNTALTDVDTTLAANGTSLANLGAAASTAADIFPALDAVSGTVQAAGDAANLAAARGYVARASSNMASASA